MNSTTGVAAPQDGATAHDPDPIPTSSCESTDQGHSSPAPLVVRVGEHAQEVLPTALADPDLTHQIGAAAEQAGIPAVFEVYDLLSWPDEPRWDLLALVARLGPLGRIRRHGAGQVASKDPFDFVLEAMVGPEDLTRCERGRRAALEAAALLHADALEVACPRIAARLKELGVKGVLPQSLLKQARQLDGREAEQDRRDATAAARRFHDLFRPAGESEDDVPALRYYRHEFYVRDGARWLRQTDEALKARVTRFLQDEGLVEAVSDRLVRDVLTNLKGLVLLDCWDEPMPFLVVRERPTAIERPRLVPFRNGLVDLDEALASDGPPTLRPHDPRHFCEVTLPYDYDAETDCPLWHVTLGGILPATGPEDRRVDLLQELMGLTILPGDLSFQKFLILVGAGGNGKSTVLETWEAMLGADNVAHVPLDALGGEFRLGEMAGKLANIAGDMNHLDKVAEGLLKQLTSGDPIQVNRKFLPPVTMTPTARLIFAANVLPPIHDRSDGVWRRMIAMPFLHKIRDDRKDRDRARRLKAELPGIFNWALAGAIRLHRQGRFTDCAVCRRCVAEHRLGCDPFRQFVEETVICDSGQTVLTDSLYDAYCVFCEAGGRYPKSQTEFGKEVLALPGVIKRRRGDGMPRKHEYVGLSLPLTVLQGLGADRRRRRVSRFG